MKTKHVPALVMLIAGLITIVLDILQNVALTGILKDLLIVLICFFVVGTIARVLLDRTFNPKKTEEQEETEDFQVNPEENAESDNNGEEEE